MEIEGRTSTKTSKWLDAKAKIFFVCFLDIYLQKGEMPNYQFLPILSRFSFKPCTAILPAILSLFFQAVYGNFAGNFLPAKMIKTQNCRGYAGKRASENSKLPRVRRKARRATTR
jgi:hypothetical protein